MSSSALIVLFFFVTVIALLESTLAFAPRGFLKRDDPAMASENSASASKVAEQKRFEPYSSSAQFVPFYGPPPAGVFYGGGQKRFDYAYGPAKRFEYDGFFPYGPAKRFDPAGGYVSFL